MKTTIYLFALLFFMAIANVNAQKQESASYKIVGNEIVSTRTIFKKDSVKPTKTNLTHTIKDTKYEVFKNSKGVYFIVRTSKKTGKQYKQYLKV